MQGNTKKIGIFLIVLGFLMIIFIVYSFFIRKPKTEIITIPPVDIEESIIEPENAAVESGETTPNDIPRNKQEYDISKEPVHQANAADIAKRSKSWADRFGSFTNQSDYGNFNDLRIFMTDSFSKWVDNYVEELRGKNTDSQNYYGITTRALSSEVVSFDDRAGKAKVVVQTERIESSASGDKAPYLQSISFDLVKEGNDWLIDAAYWEKL